MPTSYRVRQDNFTDQCETIGQGACQFVIDLVGKKWRIYEAHDGYSTTSGGFIEKGNVIKRWDLEAGNLEGKIAQFVSKNDAIAYAEKWLIKK